VRQSLVGAFFAAAVCAGALAAQQPAPAPSPKPSAAPLGPRIAVEPTTFDFGSALQQKTLNKEFMIRNFGGADLVIEGISTTCGCTIGQMETRTLKPGMAVPLRVSLETRSYSGVVQRSVLIRSNDPVKAVLEVKVQANVQPPPESK
jgi:hypothetical protein